MLSFLFKSIWKIEILSDDRVHIFINDRVQIVEIIVLYSSVAE